MSDEGVGTLLLSNKVMPTVWVSNRSHEKKHSFIYRNGLTIVLVLLFCGSFTGQVMTGLHEHNQELEEEGRTSVTLTEYLTTGHFVQTTLENWESEFLQMGLYVLLTVKFRQIGSSESKPLDEEEALDRTPDPNRPDAPWAGKKGGFVLAVYKNSLSIAFIILFVISGCQHAMGSLENFNEEQVLKGYAPVNMPAFLTKSRFWFESFQNWESEFVAVISIVVLSIFLRQHGSPESKPVDAPDMETGA